MKAIKNVLIDNTKSRPSNAPYIVPLCMRVLYEVHTSCMQCTGRNALRWPASDNPTTPSNLTCMVTDTCHTLGGKTVIDICHTLGGTSVIDMYVHIYGNRHMLDAAWLT